MYLALLLLRTAIGLLVAVVLWLVITGFLPHWGPVVAAGAGSLAGGMVCMSLGPSIGHQLALTCGVVGTLVAFTLAWSPQEGADFLSRFWPLWIFPCYAAGAALWLLIARALQK